MILITIATILLTGCNNNSKIEYTAENNTNISNIISELKKSYCLADLSKNELSLRGDKTQDESFVEKGSASFTLYLDCDWNNGCKAVRYALKRLSAMCNNDSISTIACSVYLKEDGFYVRHTLGYSYSKDNPESTVLSITEFDSDDLKMTYDAFNDDYELEPHHTWEHEGIKYSDADFQLIPQYTGWWNCDAELHFENNYSVDELIKIGESAHALIGSALTIYAMNINSIPTQTSYDIVVYGSEFYVTGENKDNTETLVWESSNLSK